MQKELIIEHASKSDHFSEERKRIFLEGYYFLKDAAIKELAENQITNNANTTTENEK